jgi:cytochrome c oxidase subunit 2
LDRKQRLRRGALTAVGVATAVGLLAGCGSAGGADNEQNTLHPAGPAARKILNLFSPFFWVAVVIGSAVVAATFYVAIRFRERPGEPRNPVQVHGNPVLEVSWTIIPFLILAVMAVPTVATIFNLAKTPKGPDVVHVQVDARQWFWEYTYTDADNQFITANEMHIPVDRPVFLTLTSNNVIHSFWVPELSGKKDVVPGHPNTLTIEASRPGTFLGQCAEYCGMSHANMRLRVIAQTASDYDKWIAEQKAPLPKATTDQFAKLTSQWGCANCHAVKNATAEKPINIGPNLTHVGDRAAFAGDIYPMKLDELSKWIHNAPSRKPHGDLVGWMPNFEAQGMTQAQATELAQFLLCDTATNPSSHPECR